jgi:hypothetical protein
MTTFYRGTCRPGFRKSVNTKKRGSGTSACAQMTMSFTRTFHGLIIITIRISTKKGDQLFNCYGLRTNRFLLLNYGFCIRNNKYNSLGFKVFVNYKKPEKKEGNGNTEGPQDEDDESKY